ncbi:unnamed protein product, partial [Plutella xylostella]
NDFKRKDTPFRTFYSNLLHTSKITAICHNLLELRQSRATYPDDATLYVRSYFTVTGQ